MNKTDKFYTSGVTRAVLLTFLCLAFVLSLCLPLFACGAEFASSAQAACVVERNSGRVLYAKNAEMPLPMASTTKIATALTVLRLVHDLDKVVTISAEACGIEGSSVYLVEGEQLTVRDLLHGLMLRSGNDCAVQLALYASGSVDGFVDEMNKTAKSLGCNETHFVTPHGLHDEKHFTTACDLAVITCAALNNDAFAQIVACKKYRCSASGSRVFLNKNKLLAAYPYADGVKTGYTKAAGRCFVGSATKDGMSVVCVLLNCPPMFEDCQRLCDSAFANYAMKQIVPRGKMCGSIVDKNGQRSFYCLKEGFCYPVKPCEKVTTQVELDGNAQTMSVFVDEKQVACLPLSRV